MNIDTGELINQAKLAKKLGVSEAQNQELLEALGFRDVPDALADKVRQLSKSLDRHKREVNLQQARREIPGFMEWHDQQLIDRSFGVMKQRDDLEVLIREIIATLSLPKNQEAQISLMAETLEQWEKRKADILGE